MITAEEKNKTVLSQIFGFLRGETTTAPQEITQKLTERITVLEAMNSELIDESMKLDFNNTML